MSRIIAPRRDIPIRNFFEVSGKGDYTVSLYYKDDWTAKVHIIYHRDCLDPPVITIYSLDKTINETFSYKLIHHTDNNRLYIPILHTVNIRLYTDILPSSCIPKVIIQTQETLHIEDSHINNSIQSILNLNPEYEYRFFTAEDRRNFIQTHFNPDVVKAYDLLVAGAYQADLFRYCYLFIEGGCYIDCKMIQRTPFRYLLKKDCKFLACLDYEKTNQMDRAVGTSLLNSIICSCAGDLRLEQMINACVNNILNQQEYFQGADIIHILDITGPTLFYRTIKHQLDDSELLLKYVITGSEDDYQNLQIRHIDTNEYVFTKTCYNYFPKNHYSELWKKGELFYRDETIVGDYKILTYPHPYNDQFEFTRTNMGLSIHRLQNKSWWLQLVIKIIYIPTSEHHMIEVGSNLSATKYIPFSFRQLQLPSNVLYSTDVTVNSFEFTEQDVVMAIPSIIHISNLSLRATSNSVKDRYNQTLEQLQSIKDPAIKVILQEMSLCLSQKQLDTLAQHCYKVILYTTDPETYDYCHVFSEHSKGLGEMAVLHHLGSHIRHQSFKHFIKFGGRYKLDDTFSIDRVCKEYPIFSIFEDAGIYGSLVYTVMYSIPKDYYNYYLEFIGMWLKKDTTLSIEQIFTKMYHSFDHVLDLPRMGIKGYCVGNGLNLTL